MDLHNYFSTQCRATAVLLKTHSPVVKAIVSGKRKQERIGSVATFSFDGFKTDIAFFEQGRAAYARQTLWISFTLSSDETVPFSIYDILAFTHPENFRCYTYTYVDSAELMKECFGEINGILSTVVPRLSELLKNGTVKNRLISCQRETVNKYFGDSVIEQSERLGAMADNLLNAMMRNFYEAQIEAAVIGAQSFFYSGKEEKALKKLTRSKCLSLYQENMLRYIKSGGKSDVPTETLKNASPEKGARRHGDSKSSAIKILLLGILIDIPTSAVLIGIMYVMGRIVFRDAIFYVGFYENIALMPFFGSMISVCLAIHLTKHLRERKRESSDKAVHTVKTANAVNVLLKCVTIIGETFALLGCVSSVYCSIAFYDDCATLSEADFPFSHTEFSYDTIDTIAIVEGYTFEEKFTERPYIAIVTESGAVIDLYNATNYSGNDFRTKAEFLKEKGVEVVEVKTIEELK